MLKEITNSSTELSKAICNFIELNKKSISEFKEHENDNANNLKYHLSRRIIVKNGKRIEFIKINFIYFQILLEKEENKNYILSITNTSDIISFNIDNSLYTYLDTETGSEELAIRVALDYVLLIVNILKESLDDNLAKLNKIYELIN